MCTPQTWGFNGNGRLGLAEPGTTDTMQRLTPDLIKTLQGAAMKDDADVGMPVDDSQVATKASTHPDPDPDPDPNPNPNP